MVGIAEDEVVACAEEATGATVEVCMPVITNLCLPCA